MPKSSTLLIGLLTASVLYTGLLYAQSNPSVFTIDYWLSDAQVIIHFADESSIKSICDPVVIEFEFNNTSTVGGGPVPMIGALLEARFPKRNWFSLETNDIDLDKGTVTIDEDGDDYVVTNLLGDIAPNDVFSMDIQLYNSVFHRSVGFGGEVRSNTFDPNPANNNTALHPEFLFRSPLTNQFGGMTNLIVDPPSDEDTHELPLLRLGNGMFLFEFNSSTLFNDDDCANISTNRRFEFKDAVQTFWLRDIADMVDDFDILNPSSPVEITTEGNDLKATFDLGNFGYGSQLDYGLSIKLNPEYSGTFEYNTEFSAENIDEDVDMFAGSGTITVEELALPDLKIWKMADQPDSTQIPMLDTLKYTLKVTNIGDADALNVEVKDTIPNPQFVLHDVNSSKGSCDTTNPAVKCEIGVVAPGDTVSVDIRVVANFPGAGVNKAYVTTTSEEATIENNISNEVIHFPVTAERRADLHVEIVSSLPDSLRNDGVFSQHVLVVNRGPNESQNATLTINYGAPVQIKFLGYIPPGSISCQKPNSNQSVLAISCTLSSLPVKGYVSVRIVGVADVQLFGSFTTEADVVAISPQDPDLTNNKDEVVTTVIPGSPLRPFPQPPVGVPPPNPNQVWADLELNKSIVLPLPNPFAPPFLVGSNIFYRYSVRNNGKDEAKNVNFTDIFMGHPDYKNYLFGSLPIALQPNCSINSGLFIQTLDCALGDLAPGGSINFGITAEAVDSIGIGLINMALVNSITPDPNLVNNSMSNVVNIYKLPTTPLFATDLMFSYSEPVANRPVSDDTLRTVASLITNVSNVTAMHATYTDTLPEALRFRTMTYLDSDEDHPFCFADQIDVDGIERDRIVCYWSTIPAGETMTVIMEVGIKQMGHLDLSGSVRSANYDKDLSNNADSLRLMNPLGTSLGDTDQNVPATMELHQNYPNPFNPSTTISFELRHRSEVVLDVFSVDGRKILRITEASLSAGQHRVHFDAGRLSSGVYIYRLSTYDGYIQRKMTLVK